MSYTISKPFYYLDTPASLGEGPIYRHSDNTLHFNDCVRDPAQLLILDIDPETGDAKIPCEKTELKERDPNDKNVSKPGLRVIDLADSVSVQYFRKDKPGSYICLYYQGIAFMDEKTGKLDILKEIIPEEDRGIRRFNDGGVDPKGRFWAAEIDVKALAAGAGNYKGTPIGRLWRYDPDGSLHLMESGIVCGNGLAWSPDSTKMYFNDSAGQKTHVYDYDNETGNISNGKILKNFAGTSYEPDGMVADVEGNIYFAAWGSYKIFVLNPKGETIKEISLPARSVTCPTWGGKNNDILYCTTAYRDSEESPRKDAGGYLFKYKNDIKGMYKNEFAG